MRNYAWLMVFVLVSLSGVAAALAQQAPKHFKDYDRSLLRIKNEYSDPWIGFLTTHEEYDLPQLRFIQACERKHLVEDPVSSNIWIITANGNVFPGRDIAAAMEDTRYFPADSEAAIKAAHISVKSVHENSDIIYGDADFDQYVPREFKPLARPPAVKKTDNGYVVTLFVSHYSPQRFMGRKPNIWDLYIYTVFMSRSEYRMERSDSLKRIVAPHE